VNHSLPVFHHAPHAVGHTTLSRDWEEALDLWERLVRLPGVVAACVMPTHVHLLSAHDVLGPLRQAMGSYTQWRGHRRSRRGEPVWRPLEPPALVSTRRKVLTDQRYVHLNPCRAGIVSDPLQWPLSTHRDAVGLALPPRREPVHQPARFHRYVSGDPSVDVRGTPLPRVELDPDPERALLMLRRATASLTRSPRAALSRRGSSRSLFLRAARSLTRATNGQIAAAAGVTVRSVERVPRRITAAARVVERVAGDPRFAYLEDLELERVLRRSVR